MLNEIACLDDVAWVLQSNEHDEFSSVEAVVVADASVDVHRLLCMWVWEFGRRCQKARAGHSFKWTCASKFHPNDMHLMALQDPCTGPELLRLSWKEARAAGWGQYGAYWLGCVSYLEGDEMRAFLEWLQAQPGVRKIPFRTLIVGDPPPNEEVGVQE